MHEATFGGVHESSCGRLEGVLLSIESGNAFSTGGDVSELASTLSSYGPANARLYLQLESAVALQLHKLSQTKRAVVALADGVLTGASAAFFLSASNRVATAATTFSMPGCQVGISPGCGALDIFASGSVAPRSVGLVNALAGGRLLAGPVARDGAPLNVATHATMSEDALWELRAQLLSLPPACYQSIVGEAEVAADTGGSNGNALVAAAVERVVSSTHSLRGDAAARIDAIQDGLAVEAMWASNSIAAAWLSQQSVALKHGCPASQIITYGALHRAARNRLHAQNECSSPGAACPDHTHAHYLRRRALGMEIAANTVLAARGDFIEGVSCMTGLRSGSPPVWQHTTRQEAASDPEVQQLLKCVLSAPPFTLDDPFLAYAAGLGSAVSVPSVR